MDGNITEITRASTGLTYKILTESDTFPYNTTNGRTNGISIVNDHATVTVTVVITADGVEHTVNCTQYNRSYSGNYKNITKVNVTAGTTYQIELREAI